MNESWITSSTQDELNARIWTESPNLQRAISAAASNPAVGAQQSMPKPEHSEKFSAKNPLPWVPDLVGPDFGKANPSVLIVGSSYNGFLTGYTDRCGTMNLKYYVTARDYKAVGDGLKVFFSSFIRDVCGGDKAYYARIRRLVNEAEIPQEQVCITDLCKASFVRQVEGKGPRSDEGDDELIKEHIGYWQCFVLGAPEESAKIPPVPYEWIEKRIEQAQIILALGKLAEYGVIKVLKRLAPGKIISAFQPPQTRPNHRSLPSGQNWQYASAFTGRGVNSWLESSDWWNIDDPVSGRNQKLLPCVHPSAWKDQEDHYAVGYGKLLKSMAAAVGAGLRSDKSKP